MTAIVAVGDSEERRYWSGSGNSRNGLEILLGMSTSKGRTFAEAAGY